MFQYLKKLQNLFLMEFMWNVLDKRSDNSWWSLLQFLVRCLDCLSILILEIFVFSVRIYEELLKNFLEDHFFLFWRATVTIINYTLQFQRIASKIFCFNNREIFKMKFQKIIIIITFFLNFIWPTPLFTFGTTGPICV